MLQVAWRTKDQNMSQNNDYEMDDANHSAGTTTQGQKKASPSSESKAKIVKGSAQW